MTLYHMVFIYSSVTSRDFKQQPALPLLVLRHFRRPRPPQLLPLPEKRNLARGKADGTEALHDNFITVHCLEALYIRPV